jgi:regulator of protease activity HflC (stomatin/prohibitin superfamily)
MTGLVLAGLIAAIVIVAIFKSIVMVPQGMQVIVERLGKYQGTLTPGLSFIVPFIDAARYTLTTKDIVLEIPKQEVITSDNAVIGANAVAYIAIMEPRKTVYGVENYEFAIQNLVQTTLRSIIGEMALDATLSSRDEIKAKLSTSLQDQIGEWGINLKTVEIQDISPSVTMQEAMEAQAAAERSRRATVTQAEGQRDAQILEAEGRLEASKRDAEAAIVLANAQKEAIELVTNSLGDKEMSAMFLLGEKYIYSMEKLAKSANAKTVIYPADLAETARNLLKAKA